MTLGIRPRALTYAGEGGAWGQPLRLTVDPDRLYLFDPATNSALTL